jgi:hypothetical protein
MNLSAIRESIQQFNCSSNDLNFKKQIDKLNSYSNISTEYNSINIKNTDNEQKNKHKEYRGNQYELDQFKNKISYMEYKKLNAKNKKQLIVKNNVDLVETVDELEAKLLDNQFKKKWTKLDIYSKKVKLKEYLDDLYKKNELTEVQFELIYKQLETLIIEKKLSKKTDILYNETIGKITEIPHMKKLIY